MSSGILVGFSIACFIISGVALAMACICWAKVVGLEKSTHQVQFVPFDEKTAISSEELDKNALAAMGSEKLEREYW